MNKVKVGLLLASLVVGAPTGSQAGPVTWKYVDDTFHIAVDSLNRMRVFSRACGMSTTAEPVALRFMADFSIKAGVSMVEVSKIVQDAYGSAPEANIGFKRDCEMKYVEFWTEAFRENAKELDGVLTRYLLEK